MKRGAVTRLEVLEEYVDHVMQFVRADESPAVQDHRGRRQRDRRRGGAGALPGGCRSWTVTELFFEPDGRFPNHGPNPFERGEYRAAGRKDEGGRGDFGVAWDGDADRVFFVDERGTPVPGDFVTTLVARHFLQRDPGAAILYDLRASWAVRDWVSRLGGRPIAEKVGHSLHQADHAAENAVFGGEVSGHYYFRDNFYADNGYIPAALHPPDALRAGRHAERAGRQPRPLLRLR